MTEVEVKPSGITSYWRDGEFIVLYDNQIWNTYHDEENNQVVFYLQKTAVDAVVIPNKQQNQTGVNQD